MSKNKFLWELSRSWVCLAFGLRYMKIHTHICKHEIWKLVESEGENFYRESNRANKTPQKNKYFENLLGFLKVPLLVFLDVLKFRRWFLRTVALRFRLIIDIYLFMFSLLDTKRPINNKHELHKLQKPERWDLRRKNHLEKKLFSIQYFVANC